MTDFRLPSLGADMDEGTLLEWRVAPGQAVKKGDIVAVVDTSKAAIDVEVWVDGTVRELLTKVGEKIPVGTVMARLLVPGEQVVEIPPAPVAPAVRVVRAAAPATLPLAAPAESGPAARRPARAR